MPVAQIARHLALPARPNVRKRRVDRRLRSIRLGRKRVIDGSLRKINTALGVSNHFRSLERGFGNKERLGIGVSDIL